MNTVVKMSLYSALEAASLRGEEDDFICELYTMATMVLWFELTPETIKYIEECSRQIRDHLEGKIVYKNMNAAP
jgi:hypothetical protein